MPSIHDERAAAGRAGEEVSSVSVRAYSSAFVENESAQRAIGISPIVLGSNARCMEASKRGIRVSQSKRGEAGAK